MGPRSRERGNMSMRAPVIIARDASMGPRSRERGNLTDCQGCNQSSRASMGPRSRERGNLACQAKEAKSKLVLQWGRAHVSAETSQ